MLRRSNSLGGVGGGGGAAGLSGLGIIAGLGTESVRGGAMQQVCALIRFVPCVSRACTRTHTHAKSIYERAYINNFSFALASVPFTSC